MKFLIYVDGAARGNPGPAGAGAFITHSDGSEVARLTKYLGETTNNVAEYSALLVALKEAKKRGGKTLAIHADSELMVKQIQGKYRVRSPHLKKFHDDIMGLLKGFHYTIVHIRREKNKIADQLANEAIDAHDEG